MNYHLHQDGFITGLDYPDQPRGNKILKTSREMGVYSLPGIPY